MDVHQHQRKIICVVCVCRKMKRVIKRNKKLWCPASEAMLVDLWQDNIEGFRGDRMNSIIHREIAAKLNIAGYNVSYINVRTKLDNWMRKYRLESSPSNWTLYKRIHSFLGEYSFADMEDEEIPQSTISGIETNIWEPKLMDTSCDDSKDPIDFVERPKNGTVNSVELSDDIDENDELVNKHESLDDLTDSNHVAATNYIRSLLCQLPHKVAQNLSFDIISMCHEEIKKHRNAVED